MYGKVSIIMPAYNCSNFVNDSVKSIINQTYTNWELVVVEDCSTDKTWDNLIELSKNEPRIKLIKNEVNSGAAVSRNKAVEAATGRYIAFLDSDDLWNDKKLEKQLAFMHENNYVFTCTSYNKINEKGEELGIIINALNVDYEGLLKRCPGNSTVIYNAEKIGKYTIPNIRKRNDYVMWLQVIKNAQELHGLDEVLSSHRVGMVSISSNKKSLVKYHWIVYRDIEKLSFCKSVYLVLFWIFKTLFKIQ